MKTIIHKLKQKPEAVRKQIVFATTILLTAIITVFWIASLGNHFSTPVTQSKLADDLKPFNMLKDNLSNVNATK